MYIRLYLQSNAALNTQTLLNARIISANFMYHLATNIFNINGLDISHMKICKQNLR